MEKVPHMYLFAVGWPMLKPCPGVGEASRSGTRGGREVEAAEPTEHCMTGWLCCDFLV